MRVQGFGWQGVAAGVGVALLCACNDNGQPAPSVTFTSPAAGTSIHLGQAVQLTWQSVLATTCTAGTSSAAGGAFTGSQLPNGAARVAPTATGSVLYTLTCTGEGGTTRASSPAVTVNDSILSTLSSISTVGSTLDPIENGGNPYGLVIAPATAGLITAGDLVVCNFNDGATNTQGLGTTIVGLHPSAGAVPYRIAQSASLEGCNALAMLPDDSIAAAAWSANQNVLVTPSGAVNAPFAVDGFARPWGEAYVPASGGTPAALYVSNFDGTIDRIALNGDVQTSLTQIATGFCTSGAPGAIFAPAGLTYDASLDTLYIVDASSNSVVAFSSVSNLPADGIVVNGGCATVAVPPTPAPTFSGPDAGAARVIAHGGPFIAPISAALLADGDLIVGNGDINIADGQMPNLAVEISPWVAGGFVGQPVQLDASGTPGALFGIAASVDAAGNPIVYFNDDNANAVMVWTR